MQDYQTLALGYAEELSDLKRRYENLERRCRGLESKLSKTRDRMKMYRARCKAWEAALAEADEVYNAFLRHGKTRVDTAKAYGVGICASLIRKEVAPTYPSAGCAELRTRVLDRATAPEADKGE